VKGRVVKYSKPGKKLMPQPAYVKQGGMPFASLLAAGALSTPAEEEPVKPARRVTKAKKPPARGPIRGTMRMRTKTRGRR